VLVSETLTPEPIMKRTIRNQRKTKHPASETNIEEEWCKTGNPDNKRLLLIDDGDEDRLVIFATDEGLQNLSNYDIYIYIYIIYQKSKIHAKL
jgi:hypothetical protein